jgi:hypothetical protein
MFGRSPGLERRDLQRHPALNPTAGGAGSISANRETGALKVSNVLGHRLMAHRDRPPFSGRPSLTGHCGHGWTCSLPRPVANDPLLRRRSSLLALQYSYSIGSSALSRIDVGTSRPSALAVVILSTVSYFTDNCTGRSAGFSLLRMRST